MRAAGVHGILGLVSTALAQAMNGAAWHDTSAAFAQRIDAVRRNTETVGCSSVYRQVPTPTLAPAQFAHVWLDVALNGGNARRQRHEQYGAALVRNGHGEKMLGACRDPKQCAVTPVLSTRIVSTALIDAARDTHDTAVTDIAFGVAVRETLIATGVRFICLVLCEKEKSNAILVLRCSPIHALRACVGTRRSIEMVIST